jgi:hypothetical protein
MKLLPEKVMETKDWSNKHFNPKHLSLSLKQADKRPSGFRIYFADKSLIFEKGMFEGIPYLIFKPDPKGNFTDYKLMPSISLERRYAFYYIKPEEPGLIDSIELI